MELDKQTEGKEWLEGIASANIRRQVCLPRLQEASSRGQSDGEEGGQLRSGMKSHGVVF